MHSKQKLLRNLTRKFTHAIVNLHNLMLKKLAVISIWFIVAPPLIVLSSLSLSKDHARNVSMQKYPLNVAQASFENSIDGQVLGTKIDDTRPYTVSRFLKGTPLEPYSAFIVQVSDEYGLDYRLIPAIAMKESGGGAGVDPASHNAWGFENGKTYFDSWEGAIRIVGKTLKTRYADRGLNTPDEIMPIYAPPQLLTGGKWAKDINLFYSQMETL